MPDLLFELFSEEIPARMQAGAERDLARLAAEGLRRAGLPSQLVQAFAGPRRLTLIVEDLPARQEDSVEERRGPRIGAPERALEGFERTTGLGRQDLTQKDGFWFAHIERPGRGTAEAIAEMAQAIIADFPWPKSMVWGEGELRWVRPLRRILCLFDGKVVPFKIGPVISGDVSEGHRFMPPAGAFKVSSITEYKELLLSHHVVLESSERRRR
ncbi:MAG TPA: glycine--tRNA ligase subunit beta, partial [Caulobacteraceae bacterium]